MPKAIFFDLGSTLWDDYPATRRMWEVLSGVLAERGIEASVQQITTVSWEVIRSYSPSLTRAIVWRFVEGDMQAYREVVGRLVEQLKDEYTDPAEFRRFNPLFPGVHELLEQLAKRYPLAVVSQHFSEVERWMDYHGLGKYFQHLSISGRERIFKPDPRLFELPCLALRVDPHDVVMVGDRLDNDIWPANRLGMTSVRVLSDPYRVQQPRYHTDAPDYTVNAIAELPTALEL